ncbi:MAG: PAS domain-containing protein [Bacteroidota bacterium]
MDDHDLKQLLAKVATDSQIGVIITDGNGITLWVNTYIQKITGYGVEQFLGNPPGKVLQGPDTDPEQVAFISRGLKSGQPFETEILNYTSDGRKFWVNLQINPVRNITNTIVYFLGVQHEITELKEKNEQLENFNYLTTHDLVNQVGNLNNLINMLSTDGKSDKEAKRIEFLKITAERLKSTTKDLRNILSYLGTSKEPELEEISLSEIIEETFELLRKQSKEGKVALSHQVPASLHMLSNRVYLSSICHNLISNAIKYRDPEKKSNRRVKVKNETQGLTIFFEDNGLGINMENHSEKLFGAFKTFHSNPDAIGIGLYLTKKQIEALHGSITLISEPKVGTTFIVFFPGVTK